MKLDEGLLWPLTTFWILNLVAFTVHCEIYLNNRCQYEDIVVKIEPGVFQDFNFRRLEYHFESLSNLTFEKTGKRISIGSVIILLPDDEEFKYKFNKTKELHSLTYQTAADSASFLVLGQNSDLKSKPYTVHFGGCGQRGEHIVVSPTLMNDSDIPTAYVGMLLLHEWAHYRWGIFDEYATEDENGDPFYLNDHHSISVTGCPSERKGWLLSKADNYSRCYLTEEGIPNKRCNFYISQKREVNISIMMGYGNDSKDYFCGKDEVRHNSNAPNLHNIKCNGKSSWDIMGRHPDFTENCSPPLKNELVNKFTFVRRKKSQENASVNIIICRDGISSIFQTILCAVRCLKALGKAVSLNIRSHTWSEDILSKISEESVIFLISNSWKNVFNNNNMSRHLVKYILDKDTVTMPNVDQNKTIIKQLSLSVPLSDLIPSFSDIVLRFLVQKEKKPRLLYRKIFKRPEASGKFYIDTHCSKAVFIISSPDTGGFKERVLKDPQERVCVPKATSRCSDFSSHDEESLAILQMSSLTHLPITGDWSYNFTRNFANSISTLTVLVFCVQSNDTKQVLSIRSKIFNEENRTFMAVSVTQNKSPVVKANISTIITSESGKEFHRSLLDDGLGPDLTENDGIYSGDFFDFGGNGSFSFLFTAKTNEATKAFVYRKEEISEKPYFPRTSMKDYYTLTTEDENAIRKKFGGARNEFPLDYFLQANSSSEKEQRDHVEKKSISKTNQLSEPIQVTVRNYTSRDVYAPGKVTDLKVVEMSTRLSTVTLGWTSAGDDGFYGIATSIILKYFEERKFYPAMFHKMGTVVKEEDLRDKTSLHPIMAREKHRIVVAMPKKNGTEYLEDVTFFFALVVKDEVENAGHVSNLAFAFFKPEKFNKELQELKNQANSGWMILCVIGFFFAAIAGFVLFVCFYRRRQARHSTRHPSEGA